MSFKISKVRPSGENGVGLHGVKKKESQGLRVFTVQHGQGEREGA